MASVTLPNGGIKNNAGEFDEKVRTTQEAINATLESRNLYDAGQQFYDTSRGAWFKCIGTAATAWTFQEVEKKINAWCGNINELVTANHLAILAIVKDVRIDYASTEKQAEKFYFYSVVNTAGSYSLRFKGETSENSISIYPTGAEAEIGYAEREVNPLAVGYGGIIRVWFDFNATDRKGTLMSTGEALFLEVNLLRSTSLYATNLADRAVGLTEANSTEVEAIKAIGLVEGEAYTEKYDLTFNSDAYVKRYDAGPSMGIIQSAVGICYSQYIDIHLASALRVANVWVDRDGDAGYAFYDIDHNPVAGGFIDIPIEESDDWEDHIDEFYDIPIPQGVGAYYFLTTIGFTGTGDDRKEIAKIQPLLPVYVYPEVETMAKNVFGLPLKVSLVGTNLKIGYKISDNQDLINSFSITGGVNGAYIYKSYTVLNTSDEVNLIPDTGAVIIGDNTDNIGPVSVASQGWISGYDHGFGIGEFTCPVHGKDSGDLGSKWQAGSYVMVLSKIVDSDTLEFYNETINETVNPNVTPFTYISGGVNTDDIANSYNGLGQKLPSAENLSVEIRVDGSLISGDSNAYGNEVKVKVINKGYDFQSMTYANNFEAATLFEEIIEYTFTKYGCRVNDTILPKRNFKIANYYGLQLGFTAEHVKIYFKNGENTTIQDKVPYMESGLFDTYPDVDKAVITNGGTLGLAVMVDNRYGLYKGARSIDGASKSSCFVNNLGKFYFNAIRWPEQLDVIDEQPVSWQGWYIPFSIDTAVETKPDYSFANLIELPSYKFLDVDFHQIGKSVFKASEAGKEIEIITNTDQVIDEIFNSVGAEIESTAAYSTSRYKIK